MDCPWTHWAACRAGIAALLLSAAAARADCTVAGRLGGLHKAYGDLIEGAGTPRARIGAFVVERELTQGGRADLREAVRRAGYADDLAGIEAALNGMTALAGRTGALSDRGRTTHTAMRDGFRAILLETGCFRRPDDRQDATNATAEAVTRGDGSGAGDGTGGDTGPDDPPTPIETIVTLMRENKIASTVIGLLSLVGAAAIVSALRKRLYRRRAQEFPRQPLDTLVDVYLHHATQPAIRLRSVDISQGGMKLVAMPEMPDMPPTGIEIAVHAHRIPAVVAWQNAHFIGFQYEDPIEGDTLEAILKAETDAELDRITRGDALGKTQNGAPSGTPLKT